MKRKKLNSILNGMIFALLCGHCALIGHHLAGVAQAESEPTVTIRTCQWWVKTYQSTSGGWSDQYCAEGAREDLGGDADAYGNYWRVDFGPFPTKDACEAAHPPQD